MEIDLSGSYGKNLNRVEIENEIINNSKNRRWIYNPEKEELICKAEQKYKEEIDKIEDEEKERKKQEELLQIRKIKYYKNKLKQYRSDSNINNFCKNLNFYKDIEGSTLPFFVDIPISGEIVFKCDRRIWQAVIFDKFIYHRKDNADDISIYKINKWVREHQTFFELDWTAIKDRIGNTYDIIGQYLTYMQFLGFISDLSCQKAKLLQSHTLSPPKQDNANLLYSAISSIDSYTQNPNKEIETYLVDAYDVFLSKEKNKISFYTIISQIIIK